MNYADIKYYDIANGPGVRVSLFVSGCTHKCKGCFNSEAWDFDYGKEFTETEENKIIAALKPNYIHGLSLLGGEPFEPQNQERLLPFLRKIKMKYPEKTVWCYTGYNFEKDLVSGMVGSKEATMEMLSCVNVLVDGEFRLEEKDLSLRFKGSRNQRIILVGESLGKGEIVLWDPENQEGN